MTVSGDLDIRVRVAMHNWNPGSSGQVLVGKYPSSGNASYIFYKNADGLQLAIYGTGGNGNGSTVNTSFTANQAGWVRATFRASDGRVQFFTATDQASMPSTWTQLGSDRTNTQRSINITNTPVEIGSFAGGVAGSGTGIVNAAGVFYYVQIRNNLLNDNTGIVFDIDLTTRCAVPTFVERVTGAPITPFGLATVGDGRVVFNSSTAGTGATLQIDNTANLNYVDLRDVSVNGADLYVGASSVLRGNVRGVRRGPRTGLSMMVGI